MLFSEDLFPAAKKAVRSRLCDAFEGAVWYAVTLVARIRYGREPLRGFSHENYIKGSAAQGFEVRKRPSPGRDPYDLRILDEAKVLAALAGAELRARVPEHKRSATRFRPYDVRTFIGCPQKKSAEKQQYRHGDFSLLLDLLLEIHQSKSVWAQSLQGQQEESLAGIGNCSHPDLLVRHLRAVVKHAESVFGTTTLRGFGLLGWDELYGDHKDRLPDPHRIPPRPLGLVHGDLHAGNVVVLEQEEKREIALLDWECAVVGDPLYDIAVYAHRSDCKSVVLEEVVKQWLDRVEDKTVSRRDAEEDVRKYLNLEVTRSAYTDLLRNIRSTVARSAVRDRRADAYAAAKRYWEALGIATVDKGTFMENLSREPDKDQRRKLVEIPDRLELEVIEQEEAGSGRTQLQPEQFPHAADLP